MFNFNEKKKEKERKDDLENEYTLIHSFEERKLNKMQYYLAFIVFSILYLSITAQATNSSTVPTVVETSMVKETTFIPVTTVVVGTTTVTSVSNKVFIPSYVEPPPHPLGYCIRSRLRCSKIRRCCQGPCAVDKMKCP
jgi:hypothetical protein